MKKDKFQQFRIIPEDHRKGRLSYITTISGKGGDLDLFEQEIDKRIGVDIAGRLNIFTHESLPFALYWGVRLYNELQFDLYGNSLERCDTQSRLFREALGNLTTLLLQAGYTVSSIDRHKEHELGKLLNRFSCKI